MRLATYVSLGSLRLKSFQYIAELVPSYEIRCIHVVLKGPNQLCEHGMCFGVYSFRFQVDYMSEFMSSAVRWQGWATN